MKPHFHIKIASCRNYHLRTNVLIPPGTPSILMYAFIASFRFHFWFTASSDIRQFRIIQGLSVSFTITIMNTLYVNCVALLRNLIERGIASTTITFTQPIFRSKYSPNCSEKCGYSASYIDNFGKNI